MALTNTQKNTANAQLKADGIALGIDAVKASLEAVGLTIADLESGTPVSIAGSVAPTMEPVTGRPGVNVCSVTLAGGATVAWLEVRTGQAVQFVPLCKV